MILVLDAPPYSTVQDLGRFGHRAQAVPPAGAMDPEALTIGNLLLGNDEGAAALELALGPGRFEAGADLSLAVTGGSCDLSIGGTAALMWSAHPVRAGTEIAIGVPGGGRFAYLCVAGGIAVPRVLGSRSTYLPGRFGGHDGRMLRRGDVLPVAPQAPVTRRYDVPLPLQWRRAPDAPIRILGGPQRAIFPDEAWDALTAGDYTVSTTADRMGYRLEGPAPGHRATAALPSEPACPGAIQVPAGSPPILLMPDGPTVGGYPKLAVVIAADLGVAGQLHPGDRPVFAPVGLTDAQDALALQRRRLEAIRAWVSAPGG